MKLRKRNRNYTGKRWRLMSSSERYKRRAAQLILELCPCGRRAIRVSQGSPVCASCDAIERKLAIGVEHRRVRAGLGACGGGDPIYGAFTHHLPVGFFQ